MGPNLNRLYLLLRRSDLTDAERDEFLGYAAYAADESLSVVTELLAEKRRRARAMLENVRAKREAFSKKDADAWGRLVEKELSDLEAYQGGG